MKRQTPRTILLLLLVATFLCACKGPAQPAATLAPTAEATALPAQPAESSKWWQKAVFYEIFVRSFYDSNGDGIGDFKGLTEKLDYLNDGDPATTADLGITAIWLMPIFPATSYHGYDVTDYYAVNPEYGTMDEFKAFLDAAHQRGIHVIIDFVMNHTSIDHPWFQAALNDPNSPYVDYYIWSQTDPAYPGPWGETVWYKASNGMYYYGVFWSGMPDLNYRNQAVRDEMNKVTEFWLKDVGVDGFRIDGARHLIEDGQVQANSEDTHAFFKEYYQYVKSINPEAMLVGEVWDGSFSASQYVKNQEMDMVFGFDLAGGVLDSIHTPDAKLLGFWIKSEMNQYPAYSLATFLTNHDINRVSNQFMANQEKMKNAAMMLLSMGGVPFIYYGEEIGMSGAKPDEMIRTPMQWSSAAAAGFSANGSSWEAVNSDYTHLNVETESADPASILSLYRALIQLRGKTPTLLNGSYTAINTGSSRVYAAVREFEGKSLLIVINLGDKAISDYSIDLQLNQPAGAYTATLLYGEGNPAPLTLDANGSLKAYKPLDELPANARLILAIEPAK